MESDTAMDVDHPPTTNSSSLLAVPRGIEVPKSPSNVALAGSPAEEREKLLDPYESGPVSSSAMSASSSATSSLQQQQQHRAATVDRLQALYADDALRRPASVMATTGSPASEREQLLEPAERATLPSSGSSDAGAAPPLSAPSTPPKRLSALPPHLQRHSALPPLAFPSGPPSPALSIQPGPPTPTGTSLSDPRSAPGPGLSLVALDQASGPIRSEEREEAGQSLGASSATLAPRAPPEAAMTTISSSERAAVGPTSVPNVPNRGDEAGKDDTLAHPHPAAPAPRDDPADINALLEARIRAETAASSDPAFAVPGLPASRSRPAPPSDRHQGLPQDIAHILTSDFAAAAPFAPSAEELEAERRRKQLAKDGEVRKLAGEMMARAGDDGAAHVQEESSDDSSSEPSSSSDNEDNIGDEKRAERNKVLETIRTEVKKDEKSSSSSSSSDFDESQLTGAARPVAGGRNRGRRRRGRGKASAPAGRDSDDDDDDDEGSDDSARKGAGGGGLRTEHEVGPEQMAALALPFAQVPAEAMGKLARLGDLASVINNVVIVKGDAGGKAVLDEGSLVCWQDGVVIGRIFETFGAVTSPHYSIRLPNPPSSAPAPGTPVFYVPSHSAFVFTQDLSRLPKGSDASNLWDEEVGGYEVEFSDDEQEAEYRRRMKEQRSESVASFGSDSSSWSRGGDRGRRGGGRGRGRGRGRGGRTSQSPRPDMRLDDSEMMPTGGQEDGYSVLRRPSAPADEALDYGGGPAPQRPPQLVRPQGPAYDPAVPGVSAAPPPPSPGYKRYNMPPSAVPPQPSPHAFSAPSLPPQQQPFFPAQHYYASPQPHAPAFSPTPYQPMPFAPPSPVMQPPPFQQPPGVPGAGGGHYNPRFYPQGGPTPPWMFRPPPQ